MIFHAVSMTAALADQAHQAQFLVECAPSLSQDPLWGRLLLSAIPSMFALGIAWLAFRWSSTQGNKQWIRDQKKAEWKELMSSVADIEHHIPIVVTGIPNHENLESIVLGILPLLRGMIFVYPNLESSGFIAKWESYVEYVSGKFLFTTRTNRSVQTGTLGGDPIFPEDIVRWDNWSTEQEVEVRARLRARLGELRDLAHRSLEMKDRRP